MVYENRKSAEVSETKGLEKSGGIAESVVLNLPEHEGSGNGGRAARRRRGKMRIAARKVEMGKEIAVSVRARIGCTYPCVSQLVLYIKWYLRQAGRNQSPTLHEVKPEGWCTQGCLKSLSMRHAPAHDFGSERVVGLI